MELVNQFNFSTRSSSSHGWSDMRREYGSGVVQGDEVALPDPQEEEVRVEKEVHGESIFCRKSKQAVGWWGSLCQRNLTLLREIFFFGCQQQFWSIMTSPPI